MKPAVLDMVVCPLCQSTLRPTPYLQDGTWIEEGILTCENGDQFPIIRGIPVLIEPNLRLSILGNEETQFWRRHAAEAGGASSGSAPAADDSEKRSAAAVWGYQWQDFHELWQDTAGVEQFYRWLAPLRPDDLRGKTMLDAGCGTGRHVLYSSRNAGLVIGVDISLATRVAARLTRGVTNAHIVQADIYRLPFRTETFDRIYSIGVIHHLPDPRAAYLNLLRHVKRNATLTVWLYGRENNWLAASFVETIRAVFTRRMPLSLLKFLSLIPATILWSVIKFFYGPVNWLAPAGARHFPYNTYFMLFNRLSFRHQWMNVFDKLNAPIANYYRRDEMEAWLKASGLSATQLAHTNDISWSLHGTRS